MLEKLVKVQIEFFPKNKRKKQVFQSLEHTHWLIQFKLMQCRKMKDKEATRPTNQSYIT